MQKFITFLKHFERRKLIFLMTFSTLFFLISYLYSPKKLEIGYQFLLFYAGLLIYIWCFIFFMLVIHTQQARKTPDPFYLFNYVTYLFLLILFSAPLIYLWYAWEEISKLKW